MGQRTLRRRCRTRFLAVLLVAALLSRCSGQAATIGPTWPIAAPPLAPATISLTARALERPTGPGERPPAPSLPPARTPAPALSSAMSAGPAATVPRSPAATVSRTPMAAVATSTVPAITPGTTLEGQQLVAALRRGGLIIFFRHAATDFSQLDSDRQNLEHCQTQRNLSARGHADAQLIGAGFQALGIPVDRVLGSPYCRTRETATLAFERETVEPGLLSPASTRDEAERVALRAAFDRLFVTPPPLGTNTVLIGHDFSIQASADLSLDEGQAGVFLTTGNTAAGLVARVLPTEWAALAARPGDAPEPAGAVAHLASAVARREW